MRILLCHAARDLGAAKTTEKWLALPPKNRTWCKREENDANDLEQPIVPAATKKLCKDIALFTQALILKTTPDRFDH